MKFLLLVIFVALSQKIEYSGMIYGMLESSQLVDKVSISRCHLEMSRDFTRISLEGLIDDSIILAKQCGWNSAAKTLLKFRNNPKSVEKASAELYGFILASINNKGQALKNDGATIGKIMEYMIAELSPTVVKFKADMASIKSLKQSKYPIAVFHGLGDCCCFPGMIEFTRYLGKEASTYSKCVEIGDGSAASWLMGFQKQVNTACTNLKKVSEFENGINVVGLSQGGLIARAVSEMCNITVHNVITLGGPHMGVMSIPNCESGFFCDIFNDALDLGVYDSFVQENFGPPGYYKDPLEYNEYLKQSNFLAAANNEKSINADYATGFKSINQLVLIEFTEDTIVDPKSSEQFGYFKIGSKKDLLLYNQTEDYINDWLGLKTLDEQGKIVFEYIVGNHLQFNNSEIQRTVIPYLI
ncbi:hypothetical protein SteCoe_9735 [Stentor coeruleus]|uniref:Palmitoyl-protein thioesterase 1 n=1 Tax=Stentor coeruleus TaxID=5963 RepID=A0A1R2CH08_9CILI|nr:hypothetical protein SteCoe_9735 [Stentor coeruleus]